MKEVPVYTNTMVLGKWTKDPPTKPGWYWTAEDLVVEVVEVYIDEIDKTLKAAMVFSQEAFDLEDIPLWWSIPILEPLKLE